MSITYQGELTVVMVEYRDIPGFPGYRVGNDGSVWSSRGRWRSRRPVQWKQLNPSHNSKGYLFLPLYTIDCQQIQHWVHWLVLEAFVGPRPQGMECRHLNGIKTDCRIENLTWGTLQENVQDNIRLGAYLKGSQTSCAKLNEEKVVEIRRRYAEGGTSFVKLAKAYCVSASAIQHLLCRDTWEHV